MNWPLVFKLSGFGAVMAIATVFVIPSSIEPIFWLAIFLFCAWAIARRVEKRHFLHGLALGVVNSAWVTGAHVAFFDTYIARHPQEAAMSANAPMAPRLMMLLTGPVIGVISGLVLGLFAFVASKLVKRAAA
jgi:hypothetical protein